MGSRLRVSNRNFATSAYKDDHFSLSLLDFRANSRLIIPREEKYRGGGNTLSLSLCLRLVVALEAIARECRILSRGGW